MARANIHLSLQGSGRGEDFWLRITTRIRESTGCVRRPLPNELSSTVLHFVCDVMSIFSFFTPVLSVNSCFFALSFLRSHLCFLFHLFDSFSVDTFFVVRQEHVSHVKREVTIDPTDNVEYCLRVALKARQMNSSVVGSTSTKLFNTHKRRDKLRCQS